MPGLLIKTKHWISYNNSFCYSSWYLPNLWWFTWKALSVAEHERSALQEKLGGVQRELEVALMDHDRIKRELQARVDQQLNAINALQADLKNFKAHLDDLTYVNL